MAESKITFQCRGCDRILNVDARLKGRKMRCAQCKCLSIIPSSSTSSPPEEPDSFNKTAPENAEQMPSDKPADTPGGTAEAPVPEEAASSAPPSAHPTLIVASPTTPPPQGEQPSAAPESMPATQPSSSSAPENGVNIPLPVASDPPPPRAPAPVSDDVDKLQERLRQAEQDLAEIIAQRDREEIAYSRTLTKLTTQLEEISHQRDQLDEELAVVKEQCQNLESSAQQQIESAGHLLAAAKQSIDDFCNEQLNSMQALREQLKRLTNEEV